MLRGFWLRYQRIDPRWDVLCKNILNQFAVNVRESIVAALEAIGEASVVQTEQMQRGGVQVVNVDGVFDDVKAITSRTKRRSSSSRLTVSATSTIRCTTLTCVRHIMNLISRRVWRNTYGLLWVWMG